MHRNFENFRKKEPEFGPLVFKFMYIYKFEKMEDQTRLFFSMHICSN